MNTITIISIIIGIIVGLGTIAVCVYTFVQGSRHEKRLEVMESNHIATLDTRVNSLYTLFGELKKDISDFKETVFDKLDKLNSEQQKIRETNARLDERVQGIERKIP